MSMDEFSECKDCGKQSSIALWVQVFRSLDQAKMSSGGLGFLSSILPGPGALKVRMCYECGVFKPTMEFSPEELESMKKFAGEQADKVKLAESVGKILGLDKKETV